MAANMAVVPQNRSIFDTGNSLTDITSGLHSLQFETSLPADQKKYLFIRKKLRAITIAACAHGTYFAATCNELRRLQSADSKESDGTGKGNALTVGIIGCGRLGTLLAQSLLTYAELKSHQIIISTRRPEILVDLQQKGVPCYYDNVRVATTVDILFLCILPAQMQIVFDEIKGVLPKDCVVYSFMAAVTQQKLCSLLRHDFTIQTDYGWNDECDSDTVIEASGDVLEALDNDTILTLTCPLGSVTTVPRVNMTLVGQWLCALVNVCAAGGMSRNDIATALNKYTLGLVRPHTGGFVTTDLPVTSSGSLRINLSNGEWQKTALWSKVLRDEQLPAAFLARYLTVFKQRLSWQHAAKTVDTNTLQIIYD